MIKVKNKGNQIFIGKTLCPNGKVTSVDENDLKAFCKTPGGAALLDTSLYIYDEDLNKQKEASAMAMRQQAEAKVRQELTPVLEKEISAKLKKEIGKSIDSLKKELESKEALIADLKKKLKTVDVLVSDDKNDNFVFDPENHLIAHRGAGKYFVMDLEDNKLHGPLTDDEKTRFETMQKAE